MTKSKWGAIIFKDECDTTLDSVTLRRTSNAEWFMSNEVLVANHPNTCTASPSTEPLRVNSLTINTSPGLPVIVEEPEAIAYNDDTSVPKSPTSPIVKTVDDDQADSTIEFDDAIPLFDYVESQSFAPPHPSRTSSQSPIVETVDDDPADPTI